MMDATNYRLVAVTGIYELSCVEHVKNTTSKVGDSPFILNYILKIK